MSEEIEERLNIFRAVTENPQWRQILEEALELQKEGEDSVKKGEREIYLGWEWFQCHTNPSTLNKMVTTRLLDISFSSNRSTYYKVRNPDIVEEALKELLQPEKEKVTEELPTDIFTPIVGHDNIKTLVRYAIDSDKPTHVLFTGPPASAKTMFLMELHRCLPDSYYCLAQTMTGAGLADVLFIYEPKALLIDEIDRLSGQNVGVLNSLMATGYISETKYTKTRSKELNTKVFASGINIRRLPKDLLSRFVRLQFEPYTEEEFKQVCTVVLQKESVDVGLAQYIGAQLWKLHGIASDIREVVQVGRLCGGNRKKAEEIVRVLRKHGM